MKSDNYLSIFVLLAMLSCLITAATVHAGDSIETGGDILAYFLPATAAGLTLAFKDFKGTVQFARSTAFALGATIALKYTTNETRPNGERYSFPSGHSAVSFASAEFIRKRYGWKYGVPAYAVAAFVAYSRVEARQHYTHDVVAGAAIGIASSYLFTKPYKGWGLQPEATSKYYGMRLTRSW